MPEDSAQPGRDERRIAVAVFGVLLAINVWGVSVGWRSGILPGNEFRQTQTAITALFIQREHNFSLAYPTPVLGKPWSVPYEFPLYQWSVVALSSATGLPLVQAGRAVSAACFYLTLPAVWLLLGRLGVPGPRRLVVLGMVLTCPLYIFYARAFMIETMALMFSLWYLAAFTNAVEKRHAGWLIVANAVGAGAGLVKVTTFLLYLVPVAAWSLVWLWRGWRSPSDQPGAVRRTAGWIAAAGFLPLLATVEWVWYTDRVKMLNASARTLTSQALAGYHFGTWESRLAGETWAAHWRILDSNIAPYAVLAACGVLALLYGGRWCRWILWCAGLFAAVQVVFPVLYALHEYYYVANAVLLMGAMGFVLCGLLESGRSFRTAWLIIIALHAGQIGGYLHNLYPIQRVYHPGGTGLTELLHDLTDPNDVLIIAGEDWSSITPYYAQRRALMIRRTMDRSWDYLVEAFGALKDERVVALLLSGGARENPTLVEMARRYFGIDPEPTVTWRETTVYLLPAARDRFVRELQLGAYRGVLLTPAAAARANALKQGEIDVSLLSERQQNLLFAAISPRPTRIYSKFGLDVMESQGRRLLNAHPDTRLWFAVAPGRRRIHAEYGIVPDAYENVTGEEPTDGVEFSIRRVKPDGSQEVAWQRVLDPSSNAADRGLQTVDTWVETGAVEQLLLATGPGPRGNYSRDWAYWVRVGIE